MRALLVILLAVVVSGGGAAAAALAMTTEQWEADRIASQSAAADRAAVADAHAAALAERQRLGGLTTEANTLLGAVQGLVDPTPGWADGSALQPLLDAVAALRQELSGGLPPGIPVIDPADPSWVPRLEAIEAEGRDAADRLEPLIDGVRAAVESLARSAVTGGKAIAGMDLATEEQRDAARTGLALVADQLRGGLDALEALAAYSADWKVAAEAQAAAKAAAEAAAAAAAAAEAEAQSGDSGSPFPKTPGCVLPLHFEFSELVLSADGTYAYVPGFECYQVPLVLYYGPDPYVP